MDDGRITNIELAKQYMGKLNRRKKGQGGWIANMGLGEELLKLKAEGKTYKEIKFIFDRDHPKPNGAKWNFPQMRSYLQAYVERSKNAASTSTSVADRAVKSATDTIENINKLNAMLNQWLDTIDLKREVICPHCEQPLQVFDSDKGVRVASELRHTLWTINKMKATLPEFSNETQSEAVSRAVEFTQLLDKMVADGSVIIVKDKPLGDIISESIGEPKQEPKEKQNIERLDPEFGLALSAAPEPEENDDGSER